MRKGILVLLLGLLALLIPGTLIKSVNPALIVPNFLLILLVFLAFYRGEPGDAVLAFLLGLEQDLGSLNLLGPWAGAYIVVFGVLALLSRRIFIESRLVIFVTVYAATLAADFLYLGMLALVYEAEVVSSASLSTALWEGFLSALFAPLLFPLLRRWLVGDRREKQSRLSRGIAVRRDGGGLV
ncbi:MAG: rod shape-determining protein MreD [Deltaproteobacteria bacterium]|nr:rod shape-determining protein MreD [Deltaproteobacteria bacterium]